MLGDGSLTVNLEKENNVHPNSRAKLTYNNIRAGGCAPVLRHQRRKQFPMVTLRHLCGTLGVVMGWISLAGQIAKELVQ